MFSLYHRLIAIHDEEIIMSVNVGRKIKTSERQWMHCNGYKKTEIEIVEWYRNVSSQQSTTRANLHLVTL